MTGSGPSTAAPAAGRPEVRVDPATGSAHVRRPGGANVELAPWAVDGIVRDAFVPVTEGVVAREDHTARDRPRRAHTAAAGMSGEAPRSRWWTVELGSGRRGRLGVAVLAPDVVEVRWSVGAPAPLRAGVTVTTVGGPGPSADTAGWSQDAPSAAASAQVATGAAASAQVATGGAASAPVGTGGGARAGLGVRHHPSVDHGGRMVQLGADRRYLGPSCPPSLRPEGGLPQGDYAPIPFLQTDAGWACWLVTAGSGTRFDLRTAAVEPSVRTAAGPLVLRLALHPAPVARLRAFARDTGRPALLPAWGYGVWKSRDVHERQEAVEEDVAGCRWHGLPLDAVVVDSPWATNYNTWRPNPDQFDDFAGMVTRLRADGVRTVVWTTPWVNVDSSAGQSPPDPASVRRHRGPAETYAEGARVGAYLRDGAGRPIVARWWMGRGSMIDFSGPGEAWWRAQAEALLRLGVRGIKADDGEGYYVPDDARFAGPPRGGAARAWTGGPPTAPVGAAGTVPEGPGASTGSVAEDPTRRGAARAWTWGDEYRRSMRRALERVHPGDGVVFGRSAWSGQQATGLLWAGDQASDFWSLSTLVAATISGAHSGISNWSHDVGGYLGDGGGRCDPELLVRWAQLGALTPLMQLHGHHEQEPWAYDHRTLELVRAAALLHETLSPHVRAAARTASRTGLPIVRPLAWLDPADAELWRVADAFAYGPGLLVAPVLAAAARSRAVRLPRGRWVDAATGVRRRGGRTVAVPAPLERIPVLVREGTIVVTHPAEHVARGLGDAPDAQRPYVATLWGVPPCGRAAARLPCGALVRWRRGRWLLPPDRDVTVAVVAPTEPAVDEEDDELGLPDPG